VRDDGEEDVIWMELLLVDVVVFVRVFLCQIFTSCARKYSIIIVQTGCLR